MRRILATVGILFLSLSVFATDLEINLNWFGASPATNRNVTLQPMSPFVGNLTWGVSDSNGICVFSNRNSGVYDGIIKAPPSQIPFQVKLLPADSGLIDATNRLTPTYGATYPEGDTAWSIATSDQRYQLSGTTASNTFYPLFSNPSNYATANTASNYSNASTNGYGNIVSLNTNQVELAGAATNAANQATNNTGIIRSDVFGVSTNLIVTNLLSDIGASNQFALNASTNNSTAERNALVATQALTLASIGNSNTAAITTATNDAWQSFTNAAFSGATPFNLFSATNLPWTGITGVGTLGQWMGIGTNTFWQASTNWTVAYVLGQGYATTNQFNAGTNWTYTNLQAQIASLNSGTSNSIATNTGTLLGSTAAALTNDIVATSNQLAAAQSAGTNTVQYFVITGYTTLSSFLSGTNQINTNLLTISTNLYTQGTNYANTNSSSLALAQGTAGSNNAAGLFIFATNYSSTNSLALAAANSNLTRGVSIVVTNLSGYIQAIASGLKFSVVVSGASSVPNVNGTNVWQSSTSWTNLNGISFVTNDASGTRIYSSGSPFYGAVIGYPSGTTTNINGSSPAPTLALLAVGLGTAIPAGVVTNGQPSVTFGNVTASNLNGSLPGTNLTGTVLIPVAFPNLGTGAVTVTNSVTGEWDLETVSGGSTGTATNLTGNATNQVNGIAGTIYTNNPLGYITTASGTGTATNLSGNALNQVTNIAAAVGGSGAVTNFTLPVSIDAGDTSTNTFGGATVILGFNVQEGTSYANGNPSHAENNSSALGSFDHSEGYYTVASNMASHAEGYQSFALGYVSHAAGIKAQATNLYSFVWNSDPNNYFGSLVQQSFSVNALGGIRFVTGGAGMTVDGVPISGSTNTTTTSSSQNTYTNEFITASTTNIWLDGNTAINFDLTFTSTATNHIQIVYTNVSIPVNRCVTSVVRLLNYGTNILNFTFPGNVIGLGSTVTTDIATNFPSTLLSNHWHTITVQIGPSFATAFAYSGTLSNLLAFPTTTNVAVFLPEDETTPVNLLGGLSTASKIRNIGGVLYATTLSAGKVLVSSTNGTYFYTNYYPSDGAYIPIDMAKGTNSNGGDEWYLVGGGGRIWTSTNPPSANNTNWTKYVGGNTGAFTCCVVNSNNYFLAGGYNIIAASTNNGVSFSEQTVPVTGGNIFNISCSPTNFCLAASQAAYITTDGINLTTVATAGAISSGVNAVSYYGEEGYGAEYRVAGIGWANTIFGTNTSLDVFYDLNVNGTVVTSPLCNDICVVNEADTHTVSSCSAYNRGFVSMQTAPWGQAGTMFISTLHNYRSELDTYEPVSVAYKDHKWFVVAPHF
jgi:hypothetical protein